MRSAQSSERGSDLSNGRGPSCAVARRSPSRCPRRLIDACGRRCIDAASAQRQLFPARPQRLVLRPRGVYAAPILCMAIRDSPDEPAPYACVRRSCPLRVRTQIISNAVHKRMFRNVNGLLSDGQASELFVESRRDRNNYNRTLRDRSLREEQWRICSVRVRARASATGVDSRASSCCCPRSACVDPRCACGAHTEDGRVPARRAWPPGVHVVP